ncbi:type IV pilus modification PilV family protein [Acetobacterium fimetarium]|nr:prepilin-type N-terminal cleavage/methylation domain-containing protein [Acetobacterium fimetarium]
MSHKRNGQFRRLKETQTGYTLVEAIIAIAICGFGLTAILGLYGMAIKTEMVSKNIFEQSIEINSMYDEISGSLKEPAAETLSEKVAAVLQSGYPDYRLEEIKSNDEPNLYTIKISHQGPNSREKVFFFKVIWRPS